MQRGSPRLVREVPNCSPWTMPIRYAAQAVSPTLPLGLTQKPWSCSRVSVSDHPEMIPEKRNAIENNNLRISIFISVYRLNLVNIFNLSLAQIDDHSGDYATHGRGV